MKGREDSMVNKEDTIRLEIVVKQVTKKDGGQFTAYETFTKENVRIDVRFVRKAKDKAPKENCFIIVNRSDVNLSRKYRYPRLYVNDIVSIEETSINTSQDDLPF